MRFKKKTILVYADDIGSGGYQRYLNGIFGNNNYTNDINFIFIGSKKLIKNINLNHKNIKIISSRFIASRYFLLRIFSRFFFITFIIYKYKPNAIFYPNGNLKKILFFRLPKIVTCHNLLPFDKYEISRFANNELRDYFLSSIDKVFDDYANSNGIIFLSSYSHELASSKLTKIKNFAIIPHGIDKILLNNYKNSYTFIDNKINLLYISPIFEYKNHTNVIKAIKILKNKNFQNIGLTLIGGGDPSAIYNLKSLIKEYNLESNIHIIGEVDYSTLDSYYANSDIFLFASSCETFGITLLEAMAKAMPIVCSNRTGLHDILKDAGVYFDPFSETEIANSIADLIENANKRQLLGRKARLYAFDYNWNESAEMTFNFLNKLIYEK